MGVDTHCVAGATATPHYDSMIATLICWGPDRTGPGRATALDRMDRALARVRVEGVPTTAAMQRAMVRHPGFRSERITTRWVEERGLPAWSAR